MSLSLIRSGAGCVGGMTGDSEKCDGRNCREFRRGSRQGTGERAGNQNDSASGRIVFQERFQRSPSSRPNGTTINRKMRARSWRMMRRPEPQIGGTEAKGRHPGTGAAPYHGSAIPIATRAPSRFRAGIHPFVPPATNRKTGHQRCAGFKAFLVSEGREVATGVRTSDGCYTARGETPASAACDCDMDRNGCAHPRSDVGCD